MISRLLTGAVLAAALPLSALAEDGVTAGTVTFGQVAAFEGPAAALGTGMHSGILAAFEEANATGGINGRKIILRSEDDGYEPVRSAAATEEMIASGDVFALIGPVGTPTSQATQPVATAAGVPFVGPFTGAGFLRDPAFGNVVNVRATYAAETEEWISYLVDERGFQNIAILYQDDGFGRVGLDGVVTALDRRGMSLAAEGTYTRNTTAVKSALLDIRKAKPDAVVIVGAYKPAAEFIKLARAMRMDPVFVNISFVGSRALADELGPDGEGVVISQVVPFPWDDSQPVVAAYRAAMTAAGQDDAVGFVSLEGYVVGRLALDALRLAGAEPTRTAFLDAIWAMSDHDMGGITLRFGPGDSQGLDTVFLTEITGDGGFAPLVRSGS